MADSDLSILNSEAEDSKVSDEEVERDEKLLSEESEETPEVEEDSEKPEPKQESESEEEEVEESTEESSLDAGELITGIKAKYPNILKEFPQLRGAIYSSREFSKLFTNPEEARETVEELDTFRGLANTLVAGSVAQLLEAVGRTNVKSLDKLASNFLPTLFRMNENLFYRAASPVVKQALRSAISEGKRLGDKNLEHSGYHLSKYLFGKPVPDEEKKPEQEDPEKVELRRKLQERFNSDARGFEESTKGEAYVELERDVLSRVDPKVPSMQKRAIAEAVIDEVGQIMNNDVNHMKLMNQLWKRAMSVGFTPESKTRIKNAYMARAKQIIPTVRRKVLSNFFPNRYNNQTKDSVRKTTFPSGGRPSQSSGRVNPKNIDWSRTSDADILNDRIKLKS